VFCQLGVQFVVARTWKGGRTGERKLTRVLSPICRAQKLKNRVKLRRVRRANIAPAPQVCLRGKQEFHIVGRFDYELCACPFEKCPASGIFYKDPLSSPHQKFGLAKPMAPLATGLCITEMLKFQPSSRFR
jgi:hypothetical protein